jgi:signal transduction histidine kinase
MDLMKNLLEWSRLHTGQLKFAPLYIDVAALINESAELLNKSARQKSVTISVELPHSLIFFADTAMMSTILKNLISNAVKYTYPGGQIVIRAEMKAAELLVSVVDNGIGISKENQEKLFRMEDIPSVVGTQNEKGTGLGLLLCKELVEEHGGRIWVKSQPGEGSTFSFSIPKAQ